MRCIKVALGAEADGRSLYHGHYGDSPIFLIYRVCEDGSAELIEKRKNVASDFEEREHGDPRKFKAVVSQLQDVDVLAGWMFGPNFLRIKKESNKVAFYTKTREIGEALKRVIDAFDQLWSELEEKRKKG